MSVAGTVVIAAPVVLEILRFANEMREIYGNDVTDEQIAQAWERSSKRYEAASDAWRRASQASS